MRAAEIRKHWNVTGGPGEYPPEMISDFALIEIAAQLAELNSFLASFAEKVVTDGSIDVFDRSR